VRDFVRVLSVIAIIGGCFSIVSGIILITQVAGITNQQLVTMSHPSRKATGNNAQIDQLINRSVLFYSPTILYIVSIVFPIIAICVPAMTLYAIEFVKPNFMLPDIILATIGLAGVFIYVAFAIIFSLIFVHVLAGIIVLMFSTVPLSITLWIYTVKLQCYKYLKARARIVEASV
jgi:hypothetical protein